MARISDAELSRLKRDVSLELLVTSSGVKLERHGAQLMGLCPFHDDKELLRATHRPELSR